jgi:hypothetical protein
MTSDSLEPWRRGEEGLVEEPGEPVRERAALRALVDRDLDDLGVLQLLAHVHEVVEERDAQAGVAAERRLHPLAMGLDALPVLAGLLLREREVREHVEDGRKERLSGLGGRLDVGEHARVLRRIRVQKPQKRLAQVDTIG